LVEPLEGHAALGRRLDVEVLEGGAVGEQAVQGLAGAEGGLRRLVEAGSPQRLLHLESESAEVGVLVAPLDAAGMVFTLDALHTAKKTARLITDTLHAHYLLALKGNRPLTRAAAATLVTGTDAQFEQERSPSTVPGRRREGPSRTPRSAGS
jgi:hypothetical protein